MNQAELIEFCDAVKDGVGHIAESHSASPESAILAAVAAAYTIADHFYDDADRSEILHRSARLLTALADGEPARTLH